MGGSFFDGFCSAREFLEWDGALARIWVDGKVLLEEATIKVQAWVQLWATRDDIENSYRKFKFLRSKIWGAPYEWSHHIKCTTWSLHFKTTEKHLKNHPCKEYSNMLLYQKNILALLSPMNHKKSTIKRNEKSDFYPSKYFLYRKPNNSMVKGKS